MTYPSMQLSRHGHAVDPSQIMEEIIRKSHLVFRLVDHKDYAMMNRDDGPK
jgi:hypothetical protein